MKRLCNRCAPSRGQALIEFTFAVGFFLLSMIGILDGGRAVSGYVMLNYAVQSGGRAAALPPPTTTSVDDVCRQIDEKSRLIAVTYDEPIVTAPDGAAKVFIERATGDRVEVTGRYQFVPVVAGIFGSSMPITIRYTSVFTVE